MEKVKIKSVINTGRKTGKGDPIIEIELEDGRKGSAFVEEAASWSGEVEMEVKPGKEFQGKMQYYFLVPKEHGAKKGFAQKDWIFEKKKAALEIASKIDSGIDIPAFLNKADQILNWINK